MAAKKRKAKEPSVAREPEANTVQAAEASKASSPKLEFRQLADPRAMVTLVVLDPLVPGHKELAATLEGAFVRVVPHPSATDEEVARTRAEVIRAKALAVRVMPTPKDEKLVRESREQAGRRETLREAVLVVASALASQDRPALDEVVERIMGKAGI
jgi:hypothetical protein